MAEEQAMMEEAPGGAAEQDQQQAEIVITTVWDEPHGMEKSIDEEGHKIMKCRWCKGIFKGWNASKGLAHLARITGMDIRTCTGRIPLPVLRVLSDAPI